MRLAPMLAAAALLLAGAARADVAPPPSTDDLPQPPDLPLDMPGELDGSWRVVSDDGKGTLLVTLTVAQSAGEVQAAGSFTAFSALCPPLGDGKPAADCDLDGVSGEITDITVTDSGVTIDFTPGADAGLEQVLRLSETPDGKWRGKLSGEPPRRVIMIRQPE